MHPEELELFFGRGTAKGGDMNFSPEYIAERARAVKIMGVLNITPDSFSDGGKNFGVDSALRTAEQMAECGVDFFDVGGESTRPGADPVPLEEEIKRVIPVIEALAKHFPEIPISVDTYKSEVARRALEAGATWVNDISGGTFSPDMFDITSQYGAGIIIMHIKGTPKTMQKNPHYDDLFGEISQFLFGQAEKAKAAGIPAEKIVIDPGIGFGKTFPDNLELLNRIPDFRAGGYPVLIGTSRKSFIGHYVDEPDPSRRDPGSYATFLWAALLGADILRVHDVCGTRQFFRMLSVLAEQKSAGASS